MKTTLAQNLQLISPGMAFFNEENTLLILVWVFGFSSCVQKKQLLYMQDIADETKDTYPTALFEYNIQSGDILYVRITTHGKSIPGVSGKRKRFNTRSLYSK
jgi:hypothetical protein